MVRYEEFLTVQKPGIDGSTFKGTVISHPAEDNLGNTGRITTTLPQDVASGDADFVEQVMAETDRVKSRESFKAADGRTVSKAKDVRGLFQAAALGHEGAKAGVQKILAERAEAAKKAEAAKQS